MEESNVEKREFGFLWNIIGGYLVLIAANIVIKNYLCPCLGLQVSAGFMGVLGVLLTTLYAIKLKAAVNQILVFIVCISFSFASIVFYIYELPYKSVVGFISIPLVLILCGMWIFTKFSKTEIK